MKNFFCLFFVILTLLSYSKEYNVLIPRKETILKVKESQLVLKPDISYPFYSVKKDAVREYFRVIPGVIGINPNNIFELSDNEYQISNENLKHFFKHSNENNPNKLYKTFKKFRDNLSHLEEFLFIQKIVYLSLKTERNEEIERTVYDYFSQVENKAYITFMFSNVALSENILTYKPLLILTAYPENSFYKVRNSVGSQDYKISSKYEVSKFIHILKEQIKFKNRDEFYTDVNFAIDTLFTPDSTNILLEKLSKEKELDKISKYLSILNKGDIKEAVKYISNDNPLTFKYSLIANFSNTEKNARILKEASLKDNQIDLKIYKLLPYPAFSSKLANSLNEITSKALEYGKTKSSKNVSIEEIKSKLDAPDEIIEYLEVYGRLIKSSKMAMDMIAFEGVGSLYKNYKAGYKFNIKRQRDLIVKTASINNTYLKELYMLTLARISMSEAEIILKEISKYKQMDVEMALLLENVNYCISLSPLVKSDKDLNARYGAAFIGLSLTCAKSKDDFERVFPVAVDYLREYDNTYFLKHMKIVRGNFTFRNDLSGLNNLTDFEKRLAELM